MWKTIVISSYNLEKSLLIFVKKLSSLSTKNFQVEFTLKTILSTHTIHKLARQGNVDSKKSFIQKILKKSEQLAS